MDIQEIKTKKQIAEKEIAHILERLETETGMSVNLIYPMREHVESELTTKPVEKIKVDITLIV